MPVSTPKFHVDKPSVVAHYFDFAQVGEIRAVSPSGFHPVRKNSTSRRGMEIPDLPFFPFSKSRGSFSTNPVAPANSFMIQPLLH